jgi:hypothetical protein
MPIRQVHSISSYSTQKIGRNFQLGIAPVKVTRDIYLDNFRYCSGTTESNELFT